MRLMMNCLMMRLRPRSKLSESSAASDVYKGRYGVSAGQVSHAQAAQLASVLPNPLEWRPGATGRAGTISARMNSVQLGINGPCES